ncbi:phthiocerol/phthiodiolone dimycocerosyl transferase family protein [Nocardia thailandica]
MSSEDDPACGPAPDPTAGRHRVLRPLGPSERWFWLIDQFSPANCVVRIRVRGPIPPYRLEDAMAALVAEFPLLRSVVLADGPRLVPSPDPHIPVLHRLAEDPEEWRALFDDQLADRVDLGSAPGRLIDVAWGQGTQAEHHDLILTMSHVLVDGRSIAVLGRRLLAHAFGLPTQPDRAPVPAPDSLVPPAFTGMVRTVGANITGQVAARLRGVVRLPGKQPPLPARRTRTVLRAIAGDDLAALRARCRAAGVGVNAALTAALGRAMGELGRPGRRGLAGIGVPVDVRSRLRPPPDDGEIGLFVAVLPQFVPFGPTTSVWTAARDVQGALARQLARGRDLRALAAIRHGCPRDVASGRRVIELVDRQAPWNVTLSNLGTLTPPETAEPLDVAEVTVAGANSCASALTVAVATLRETLSITFCYVEGTQPAAGIEALADSMLAALARDR